MIMDVSVCDASFRVAGDHAAFWQRVAARDWEPSSYDVLTAFLRPNSIFVDIGAWIGPLTLYAAAMGARCLAFEPDPVARDELLANLALEPEVAHRVSVRADAVGAGSGPARLGNITSRRGGDSMSSLLFSEAPTAWEVTTVGLVEILASIPTGDLGLVKIDIEGAEVETLAPTADYLAAQQPPLYLSVHPRFWSDPHPRLIRLAGILSAYDVVLTPELVPFDLAQMFTDPYVSGLFELVCCSTTDRPPTDRPSTGQP